MPIVVCGTGQGLHLSLYDNGVPVHPKFRYFAGKLVLKVLMRGLE
tara:strand:+ start:651 stop:785 length:135 start_codon:yes stop_codon:yes gene_type:complete